MSADQNSPPGLTRLIRRLVKTSAGAVGNRLELLGVEWDEERARFAALLVWTCVLLFCGLMASILVTAMVLLLVPEEHRVVAVIAFAVLYLGGAILAWFSLRAILRRESFPETLNQLQKDRKWLDSLN